MAPERQRSSVHPPTEEDREPPVDPGNPWIMNSLNTLSSDLRDLREDVKNLREELREDLKDLRDEIREGNRDLADRTRKVETKITVIFAGVAVITFLLALLSFWTRPLIEAMVQLLLDGR